MQVLLIIPDILWEAVYDGLELLHDGVRNLPWQHFPFVTQWIFLLKVFPLSPIVPMDFKQCISPAPPGKESSAESLLGKHTWKFWVILVPI